MISCSILRILMNKQRKSMQNTIILSVGDIFKLRCVQVGKMDASIQSVLKMTAGELPWTE